MFGSATASKRPTARSVTGATGVRRWKRRGSTTTASCGSRAGHTSHQTLPSFQSLCACVREEWCWATWRAACGPRCWPCWPSSPPASVASGIRFNYHSSFLFESVLRLRLYNPWFECKQNCSKKNTFCISIKHVKKNYFMFCRHCCTNIIGVYLIIFLFP